MKSLYSLLGLLALLTACQPAAPGAPTPGQTPARASGAPATGSGGNPGARNGQGFQGRAAIVSVQVETVKVGPLMVQNSTGGTVAAQTQSSVAAGASGTVQTLVRKAGDWVEAGTTVIRLDDSQLTLSMKIAQANLENAKINAGVALDGSVIPNSKLDLQLQSSQSALAAAQKNYASAQALFKIGGISGSDLDTALTQVQTAQANLEAAKNSVTQNAIAVQTATLQVQQAQLNLQYATIKAPYAGQIVTINVHPGEYVTPSTAAFILVSRAKIVNFNVPPADAVGLSNGSKIQFSQAGKIWPVTLTGAPSAPVNGQVPLTAALPANFPGAFGTVGAIQYSQVLATGVLVPLPAIQSLENSTYAFEVKNNKASRADLVILANSGSYAAVSGIADGAVVILNPPPGLLVGATIQVVGAAQPGQAGQEAKGPAPAEGTPTQKTRKKDAAGAAPAPAAPGGQ